MGFTATEKIDVWVSLTPLDVPPLSPALFKTFWVNFADLKVYTAKFNVGGALELVTMDLSALGLTQPTSSPNSTMMVDLEDSSGESITLPGEDFTPPITQEPSIMAATQVSESGVGEVVSIIDGFTPNSDGIHWDIIISPQSEEMLNVKISIS